MDMTDMTDFEIFGLWLLDLLEASEASEAPEAPEASGTTHSSPSLAVMLTAVDAWAQHYDRGEKIDPKDGTNKMHVLGMALCVLLHRCQELAITGYDLRAALGSCSARVMLCNKALEDHDIQDLQNLVTALQLEFTSLYTMQEPMSENDDSAGFWSLVNTEDICIRIMKRLGSLLGQKQQEVDDKGVKIVPLAAIHGLIDIDDKGYYTVSTQTAVHVLDALHSLYGLNLLLTRAKYITVEAAAQELVPVHAHHREASNETFFIHSMTADCVVGTIAQYCHRYAHLFHSVSQVIYYNYPTYNRQTQLPLLELQRENATSINLLPLLTELRPDIPVLFEHTGAGCSRAHEKHKWSWVLWSQYVLLVDSKMNAYIAKDCRTLTHYAVI
jgi:hypothetical protein